MIGTMDSFEITCLGTIVTICAGKKSLDSHAFSETPTFTTRLTPASLEYSNLSSVKPDKVSKSSNDSDAFPSFNRRYTRFDLKNMYMKEHSHKKREQTGPQVWPYKNMNKWECEREYNSHLSIHDLEEYGGKNSPRSGGKIEAYLSFCSLQKIVLENKTDEKDGMQCDFTYWERGFWLKAKQNKGSSVLFCNVNEEKTVACTINKLITT